MTNFRYIIYVIIHPSVNNQHSATPHQPKAALPPPPLFFFLSLLANNTNRCTHATGAITRKATAQTCDKYERAPARRIPRKQVHRSCATSTAARLILPQGEGRHRRSRTVQTADITRRAFRRRREVYSCCGISFWRFA